MTTITSRRTLLPTVLRVDGWSTALFGAALALTAPLLRDPLGLPTPFGLLFGAVMITGGATILTFAVRDPHRYARPVAAVNAASALAMTAFTAAGILDLTGLGIAFFAAGAALVALFAALEYAGLRQATR
ncbi:hypothetical protein ACSVDM_05485 [Nocardia sp. JW2]|uniref:hypothetical protein n=1 Tax=Nocardia sp. JW2 TaxID=3450738 RepID=UPI003F429568